MKLSTCTRHPGHRFAMTCPGCAQDCHDAQYGNPARQAREAAKLADRVRNALGRYITDAIRTKDGETPTRRLVWSLHELGDLWDRHPNGTLTKTTAPRTDEDGAPYTVTEVTLTVDLPGIGTAQVFTDVGDEDEYPGGMPNVWYFAEQAPAAV